MRAGRASKSAALVAALRGLSALLPPGLCTLAPDALGVPLAGAPYTWLEEWLRAHPRACAALLSRGVLHRCVLCMTLRTRCIDDTLRRFVAAGGRQVLLLGAGLDARPWRLAAEMPTGCVWFSVDHPATQLAVRDALATVLAATRGDAARARAALGDHGTADSAAATLSDVRWISHDFEKPMAVLQQALHDAGLDSSAPVLTIWEGVVMYLSEPALNATLALVRAISGPKSVLAFDHLVPGGASGDAGAPVEHAPALAWLFWPRQLLTLQFWIRAWLRIVAGERIVFMGWRSNALPAWLAARGWRLRAERSYTDVAAAVGIPQQREVAAIEDGQDLTFAERFVEATLLDDEAADSARRRSAAVDRGADAGAGGRVTA